MATLDHAARYFPILDELRKELSPTGTVVEIGSGSTGIGEFWSRPFVGCDLSFASRPKAPMLPVLCSADALPFRDEQFDALVASDVMEHIPPAQRSRVISECFRISRSLVIIGYPCGPRSWALDADLHRYYQRRRLREPMWLREHMADQFPDETLLRDVPGGWTVAMIPNENLAFHSWMMRAGTYRVWSHAFRLALLISPGIVRWMLRLANAAPQYRMIFVCSRAPAIARS